MPPPATGPDGTTQLGEPRERWQRVWVWAFGGWHPGLVIASAEQAALVAYRTASYRSMTDTVRLDYLAARDDRDDIDREIPAGHSP